MNTKICATLPMLGALVLMVSGFTTETLMKDFVSFDKAFIPPLALTNQEKVNPSKKAMQILKETWSTFKSRHYEGNPKDAQWKKDLDGVEARILKADGIVKGGSNLMEAHEILEEIRYAFMNLRKRNNIEYYLDHLSVFHEHMEAILHTASERDAGSFTIKDKEHIGKECAVAIRLWDEIQSLPFDRALFGFDDQKLAQMKELLNGEAKALSDLKKALGGEDNALIIKKAKAVRPEYAQLYKMFGDFDRVMPGKP